MKKYLLLILLLSSCATQRRCELKFPHYLDTLKTVEVKDTTIYRDTTIFIPVQGKTVIDSVLLPCPPVPNYIPDTVKVETDFAKAFAWWHYPHIRLMLIQKDTTIKTELRNALKDVKHWRSEFERVTNTVVQKADIPKIYKISLWVLIGLIVATGARFALKFIK